MPRPNLQKLLSKWQRILKLRDWDIRVRYVRGYEMDSRSATAQIEFEHDNRRASIRVLAPEDYYNSHWPQDVERDVVHELGHLICGRFAPTERNVDEEQAVERFANALVELDRR